jgi:hypothetical protein
MRDRVLDEKSLWIVGDSDFVLSQVDAKLRRYSRKDLKKDDDDD